MGPREKQQAVTKGAKAASSKGSDKDKAGKGKGRAPDPPDPPVSPARGRRAGAVLSSDAAQDARDEAQVMATAIVDADKTPSPSPPPPSRGGGGLSDGQKK